MAHFADNVWFITETCCNCHMQFAMTQAFHKARMADRKSFYCPSGHSQHYTGESEEAKLKRELERVNSMVEAAQARANTVEQQRAEIQRAHSRMRSRVMNGVCPCCNRTFENLARHMKSEHAGEMTLKTLRDVFGMTQGDVAREVGVTTTCVSLFENQKRLPEYAKQSIQAWMQKQEATK